ncbi:hypothetical protein M1116_03740 [Patescibacteria group bacterium]|nr:hypothetical protein [Patescibacteria group bacterium]
MDRNTQIRMERLVEEFMNLPNEIIMGFIPEAMRTLGAIGMADAGDLLTSAFLAWRQTQKTNVAVKIENGEMQIRELPMSGRKLVEVLAKLLRNGNETQDDKSESECPIGRRKLALTLNGKEMPLCQVCKMDGVFANDQLVVKTVGWKSDEEMEEENGGILEVIVGIPTPEPAANGFSVN